MKLHLTATGCHLPYEITQCHLPPDAREHILLVLNLPTPEGWKAELT